MVLYEVDNDQWAVLLKPLLDVKTSNFMDRLSQEVQDDFDALGKALIDFNGINAAYHCRQDKLTWSEETSPMETFLNIRAINQSWTAEITSLDKLRDHFNKAKFLHIMPNPAMLWVRERNAATGHDVAELACAYFADRPMVESQPRKFQGYRQGSYQLNPNRPYSQQDSIQEEQRAKEEKPTEKK